MQVNLCNSCGECLYCGRNKNIEVEVCELCGDILYEVAYDLRGEKVCKECFLDNISEVIDDYKINL